MTCPNCGSANADDAKFCWNCGTALSGAAQPQGPYQSPSYQTQNAPYQGQSQFQPTAPGGRSVGKNIAIGCLVAVIIVFLFGLSCMRACFGRRRYYRYGEVWMLRVNPPRANVQAFMGSAPVRNGYSAKSAGPIDL